ncbi:MAG: glycosyltransferase family 2 protein [Acidaminococcaceae bacterium]|nr:glycosyltransferase family 2 protein [Acidaminococcaceae bacterium]
MLLSIIVPCFNEEDVLPIFIQEIDRIAKQMAAEKGISFEFLFINDGSSDGTLELLRTKSRGDSRIRYISFSRNFGKESAIYAGLCNANGDYTAVMDADMQDPPSLLPEMLRLLEAGEYDCVATRRSDRTGEPIIRSYFARCFYKLINKISDADIIDGARDFRLMKRGMVDAIVSMKEYNRFSKGIFGWVGFRTYWLSYDNVERAAGVTKWNFWKLFKYAIDGIINFSEAPLRIASWMGMIFTGVSILSLLFIVLRRLIFGDPVAGWASTICVIIFSGGSQLLSMGIMGQYIAKAYSEVKQRPHYIVSEESQKQIEAEQVEVDYTRVQK